MGFFSWITQDTNKSIANNSSKRETFEVTMMDDKGNTWTEKDYEGYGVFGGKDYYVLLGEMNGIEGVDEDEIRERAITLNFDETATGVKYPNLVQYPNRWEYINESPNDCPDQGYFYYDEEDDEEYYDEDNY